MIGFSQMRQQKNHHVVEIPAWMSAYKLELITKREDFERVVDECIEAGYYGLDLETTGLDTRIFPRESSLGTILKTNCEIVGLCLSPGGKRGYYVPLRHSPPRMESVKNYPWAEFEEPFDRLLDSNSIPVVHNGKYEGEVLSYTGRGKPFGNWESPKQWEDCLILAALDDSTRKSNSLKALSKAILEKTQIELKDLFPAKTKRLDFSLLDPEMPGVLEYGTGDAICTIELFEYFRPRMNLPCGKSMRDLYAIEKLCTASVRWMERARVHIDLQRVQELMEMAQRDLFHSLAEVYRGSVEVLGRDITPLSFYLLERRIAEENPDLSAPENHKSDISFRALIQECKKEAAELYKKFSNSDFAVLKRAQQDERLGFLLRRESPGSKDGIELGIEYDVLSNAQLGILLWDLGVKGLDKTATGKIKTAKDVLDKIIDSGDLPFIKRLKKMRGNDNALGKLAAIYRDTDRRDSTIRIAFHAYAAGTGRFSTKGDKKYEITGGTTFNLQSMPSPKDPERPPALLLIRECISARDNKIMVAIDLSGAELRINAFRSGEKKWINAFFTCSDCGERYQKRDENKKLLTPPKFCNVCGSDKIGDLHTLTALEIFGKEIRKDPKVFKLRRSQGKNTNFAINYGGGAKAVQRQTGVGVQESYRIVKQFQSVYPGLKQLWKREHEFARKHGYVLTSFYRKFPLPDIKHVDKWVRSKAERNAINSPIQGTNADIIKIAMGMVHRACKKRGWIGKVIMTITMHDELVFEIDRDILEEAIQVITHEMTNNAFIARKKWAVPLTVDIEMGLDWSVPWNLDVIKYRVALRRELQTPNRSQSEILASLRRVNGFYDGKEKVKKLGSFEAMQWPEEIREHFQQGREERPLTDSEQYALKRAWIIFFNGVDKDPGPWDVYKERKAASQSADGFTEESDDGFTEESDDGFTEESDDGFTEESEDGFTEESEKSEKESPKTPNPLSFRIRKKLTATLAYRLSRIIDECRGSGKSLLVLESSEGRLIENWFSEPIYVDHEKFLNLTKKL